MATKKRPWQRVAATAFTTALALGSLAGTAWAQGPQLSFGANIRVNTDKTQNSQIEETMIVNPNNPRNVIAASKTYGFRTYRWNAFYTSNDGGKTWTAKLLPRVGLLKKFNATSDPELQVSAKTGHILFSSLAFNQSGGSTGNPSGVFVSVSSDGGKTWPGQGVVSAPSNTFNDKDWIYVDNFPTSPTYGNVFASWMGFSNSAAEILFATSSNEGKTFSKPVVLYSGPANANFQNPWVETGPKGQLYLSWTDWDTGNIRFISSTNGGKSWTAPANILAPGGVNGFQNMQVDASGAIDLVAVGNSGNLFISSADGGKTWTKPVRINDSRKGFQFMPTLAIGPKGQLVSTFYDTRNGNGVYDVYAVESTDGGKTWSANTRVTDKSSQLPGNIHDGIGDYMGLAIGSDGVVHPDWTDQRNGNPDIFTANGTL